MAEAPPVAGYCGRCGAPFTADTGAFCGRCGNPIVAPPAVATGYSYPVMPPATVPAAHHKLTRGKLFLFGGGALVVVVVLVTLFAVVLRPTSTPCGLFCGPRTGPRLVSQHQYKNAKFGYTVEYDSNVLTMASHDDNGAEFDANNGDGSVVFTATSGNDVNTANQNAFNNLNTSLFQGLQQIGPVRGAEIGLVTGQGSAYQGQFVPPDGSSASQIGLVVFSASQNNVTITVTAFSGATMDNAALPYGLDFGEKFDFPITNTIWKS